MKKKILFLVLFLVAAAVSFQMGSKRENPDSLMLENIEALTSEEWNKNTFCIGYGTVDCPFSHEKVKYVMEKQNLENRY